MAKRNGSSGSGAASPSTTSSMPRGSESGPVSAPEAEALNATEHELVRRLIAAGAISVLVVRDEIRVTTPGGVDWRLGPGQWLLVQLPLDGRLPDGAIYRVEKAEA